MANAARLSPALFYADPAAALDFLERAFGFETAMRITDAEGRIQHAEMDVGGGTRIMLGPAGWADWAQSPKALGGACTQMVHVAVTGVDAHCARARAAGAVITREPEDQFYGDRSYAAADPEGHCWSFGEHIRDVSNADMEAASGLKVEGA